MSDRPLRGSTEHFFGFSLGWRTIMVIGGCMVFLAARLAAPRRIIREHPLKETCHERGTQVLLDVRLRAQGRQFDEQALGRVQAKDQGTEADPRRRRLLRAVAQWRA